MSYIRVVRKLSLSPGLVPSQMVNWGNGLIDYVTEGTRADIPQEAVYAAILENGQYKTVVQPKASFVFKQHFSGWDPSTWPYPS